MKSLKTSFIVTLVIFSVLFLHLGDSNILAAKKKTFEQLKFPELNSFQLPEIQKIKMNNGINLRLIKDEKLPLITLEILFKGGSAYDPFKKIGLASVTANLMQIGGTQQMKSDELDKFLDSNGISIDISAETDLFRISLTCLKDNLDNGLKVISEMLQEPAFDPDKLDEIKTRMSSAISRRNDDPDEIQYREFFKLIYGGNSPFAAILEYEHIENITQQDIVMMHQTFFAPDNMLVGVIGPLEMDELEQKFKKNFGKWKHHAQIPPFPKAQEQSHDFKVAFAEKSNLNQGFISIGHLGEKYNLEERGKTLVFNTIFSSGFNSRLFQRIRVKMGLTYGAGGGIIRNHLYKGANYFETTTKSESTLEAIKAILDEIDLIRKEPVSEDELKQAKDYYLNSFVFNYSTPAKILYRNLVNEFYGLPEDTDKKTIEDIKKVSIEDIKEIANQYLHPDQMVVLVVGNEEKIKQGGDLAELGKIKKIDISIPPPSLKEKIPPASPEMLDKGQKIIASLLKTSYNKYQQLKSLEVSKSSKMSMGGRTIDMESKTSILYPDKVFSDISFMGGMMKMEYIVNGKKGVIKQMGQKKIMEADDIYKSMFGELYDVFFTKEKGKYKFQYLKEEKINGKPYDVIYIFDANKNWTKFFINQETHLLEIEEKVTRLPGQSGISRTFNSDFKLIKGVPFPFKSETFVKEQKVMSETVKEIKVNPSIDPSIFKIESNK